MRSDRPPAVSSRLRPPGLASVEHPAVAGYSSMSPKQFATLSAAAAVQNLQISSPDGGRCRFRVSRAGGLSTLYFRLDGQGKFSRAGGCEQQASEVDLLLFSVLAQAGNDARAACTNCVHKTSIDCTCSGCNSSVPADPVRQCKTAST